LFKQIVNLQYQTSIKQSKFSLLDYEILVNSRRRVSGYDRRSWRKVKSHDGSPARRHILSGSHDQRGRREDKVGSQQKKSF